MKPLYTTLLLLVSFSAIAQQAPASTAWRCGADARSYSDQPCREGRVVVVADARSASDLAQAKEVAARERALAKQMIEERHEREREAALRGSGFIAIKPLATPVPRPVAAKKASKKHRLEAARTSASTVRATRQNRG